MDGKGGMDGIEGKWTVSEGAVRGECVFRLDNRARTVIRLQVEGVVRDGRIRLAMRGIFPKSRGDGVSEMPMTVYVESRPQ